MRAVFWVRRLARARQYAAVAKGIIQIGPREVVPRSGPWSQDVRKSTTYACTIVLPLCFARRSQHAMSGPAKRNGHFWPSSGCVAHTSSSPLAGWPFHDPDWPHPKLRVDTNFFRQGTVLHESSPALPTVRGTVAAGGVLFHYSPPQDVLQTLMSSS